MYLSPFKTMNLDALILACTHYPLLKPAIDEYFHGEIQLVDSAEETAQEVSEVLKARRIAAPRGHVGSSEFYVSDSPDAFIAVGSPFLGQPMERVFLEPVWQRDIEPAG